MNRRNDMDLKGFRTLHRRDFDNGAVLDAIEQSLKDRELLITSCKYVLESVGPLTAESSMHHHTVVTELTNALREAGAT